MWEVNAVTLSLSRLILSLSPEEGEQDGREDRRPDEKEEQEREEERGEEEEEEAEDVLDRQKCQSALASLRHAKWFQVRTAGPTTRLISLSRL